MPKASAARVAESPLVIIHASKHRAGSSACSAARRYKVVAAIDSGPSSSHVTPDPHSSTFTLRKTERSPNDARTGNASMKGPRLTVAVHLSSKTIASLWSDSALAAAIRGSFSRMVSLRLVCATPPIGVRGGPTPKQLLRPATFDSHLRRLRSANSNPQSNHPRGSHMEMRRRVICVHRDLQLSSPVDRVHIGQYSVIITPSKPTLQKVAQPDLLVTTPVCRLAAM